MKHKRKSLLSLILTLLLLFAVSPPLLATGVSHGMTRETGPYKIIFVTSPEHLVANQQISLEVTIVDKVSGQPVTGANVVISDATDQEHSKDNSTMDSEMNDSEMTSDMNKSDAESNGIILHEKQSDMDMARGTYMAETSFDTAGQFNELVKVNSSLGESAVTFPIDVAESGPNWVFLGIVGTVIVISALISVSIRRKNLRESRGTL